MLVQKIIFIKKFLAGLCLIGVEEINLLVSFDRGVEKMEGFLKEKLAKETFNDIVSLFQKDASGQYRSFRNMLDISCYVSFDKKDHTRIFVDFKADDEAERILQDVRDLKIDVETVTQAVEIFHEEYEKPILPSWA